MNFKNNINKSLLILLAITLLSAGCGDSLIGPRGNEPLPEPKEPPIEGPKLGLVKITISGIGTEQMSSKMVSVPPKVAFNLTEGSPESSIQAKSISTGSFTVGERGNGGMRYIFVTYKVRNARRDGTPYNDARQNLTFLAVDNDRTIGLTPIFALRLFDGTELTGETAENIAQTIVPTGQVHLNTASKLVSTGPDVLQVFTEGEVADLSSSAYNVFPYGFIVRSPDATAGSRRLPADPGTEEYDGLITFAYKLPLQEQANKDPFEITMMFLTIDDNETRITRSVEEALYGGADAFEQRVTELNATSVTLLGNAPYGGSASARTLCDVRLTGSSNNPTALLNGGAGCVIDLPRYYVDADVATPGDGSTWNSAFNNLQDALAAAGVGDEIWVAEGTYTPDPDGSDGYDRALSFTITGEQDGLKLYGGFVGGETSLSARDPEANPTILSGDLKGDDKTGGSNAENSYHVLFLDGTVNPITNTTVIDGFMITGGNANGDSIHGNGGGLFCKGRGSGSKCSPVIQHTVFANNDAKYNGGAMYYDGALSGESNPVLIDIIFKDNSAEQRGGGAIFNDAYNGVSSPTLTNVIFFGNSSGHRGGAMYNYGENSGVSSPELVNVTFFGNSAVNFGGAIFNGGGTTGTSNPAITNGIFWGNTSTNGPQIYNNNASPTVSYSIIQGGCPAGADCSNILTADPDFVDVSTTDGDGLDLSLKATSPAINAGDNTPILNLGIPTDLAGNERIIGDKVDMGAYENEAGFVPDVGVDGKALAFDGTDDYIEANSVSDALHEVDSFTLEAWVFPKSESGANEAILAFNSSVDGNLNTIYYEPELDKFFYYDFKIGDQFTADTFTPGRWYHLAVVIDASNNGMLYVNGELQVSFNTTERPQSGEAFSIGQEFDGHLNNPSDFFTGQIDEVRIWNTALNQHTIKNWKKSDVTSQHPYYESLVAYYKLSEGSGTTTTDASGNGRSGTLINGPTWMDRDGSVVVTPQTATLKVGETRQFSADTYDLWGETETVSVNWTTSDNAVATVSGGGLATGEGPGVTQIIATAPDGRAGAATLGIISYALAFDGIDDYVEIPHNNAFNLTNTFTLEAWITYFEAPSGMQRLISKEGAWSLAITSNEIHLIDENDGTIYSTTLLEDIPVGRWVHIAATFEFKSMSGFSFADVKFYINGEDAGSAGGPGYAAFVGSSGSVFLGQLGNSEFFKGVMDEVAIWSAERSSTQIQADMNGIDPASTKLVAYYKMEEGSGTTTADATGNGHTGTLKNGTQWVEIVEQR